MLVAFIIVHLYLITTGKSITSNLKAMITGYEELEKDDNEQTEKNIKAEEKLNEAEVTK